MGTRSFFSNLPIFSWNSYFSPFLNISKKSYLKSWSLDFSISPLSLSLSLFTLISFLHIFKHNQNWTFLKDSNWTFPFFVVWAAGDLPVVYPCHVGDIAGCHDPAHLAPRFTKPTSTPSAPTRNTGQYLILFLGSIFWSFNDLANHNL